MAGDKDPKDTEGSSGVVINHNSPYYLHPSDFPKQLHVNDVLTDSNYVDWSQEMTNFLFAKNKIDFVDGTILKPEKTSPEYKPWMRCDAMIKGWLTTAMEKNIRDSVKYATISSEIWSGLHERFGKESAPRGYELRQKIAATRQDGATVSTYYTRLRSLWDEATQSFPRCSCNKCTCELSKKVIQHLEKERLYEFLMVLDSDFTVIKTQILATKPTLTLGVAYHMVAEDERQRAISNENRVAPESAAFKAFQKREGNISQTKEKYTTKQGREGKENDHCTFCGKDGHKREGCFKLVGYPDWWPGKKGDKAKPKAACVETGNSPIPGLSDEQYQSFVKFFSGSNSGAETKPEANMAGKGDDTWVMDSGCTEYIAHEPELIENTKRTSCEALVVIPNGDAIPVEGKGESTLARGYVRGA
ncbi:putative transcription factor interactor and regulator CCHC(Zn) family [Helianthus annuus]|nr:putative transcription factor interactor and regulator CCHC(Zn) family [Helianthus annuus]